LAGSADIEFVPMLLERFSGAVLLMVHVLILALALAFPVPLRRAIRLPLTLVLVILAAAVGYRILTSYDYVATVVKTSNTLFRIEGSLYRLLIPVQAAIAGATALFLIGRSIFSTNRIHRQRSAVAAAGIIVGTGFVWIVAGGLPSYAGARPAFSLTPLGCLVTMAVVNFAVGLSRLFDWRAIGRVLASYATLAIVVGVPTGIALALVMHLRGLFILAPAVGGVLFFLIGWAAAKRLSSRFLERAFLRERYREELESELSHIDLSIGRDHVLSELYRLLSKAFDFTDFSLLIEDDRGSLRGIYSSTAGARTSIEKETVLAEILEKSGATVILKSEAQADAAYAGARAEMAGLFEELRAEALLVVREGRKILGLFVLGARSTGADYTSYDYETFRSIYGKLFVFAYYLKNVARGSIVRTIDRELALTDQVIRYVTENIDPIKHPNCDAAWSMQSIRQIGGDFVDFIQLSKDRWFFVMGDISGMGLSASMSMLVLKSMIRTFIKVEKDLGGLVSRVNLFIKENLPRGTFFAGVLGYFDLSKDIFYYINCGIPTILLYSPNFGTFVEVQGEGKVLGFVRNILPHLKPKKLVVPRGSVLVATTDGLTDGKNLGSERFGAERLRKSVIQRLERSAKEIADGVLEDLNVFTDRKIEDDITLLVMKFGMA